MISKQMPSGLVPVVENRYWRERDAELVLSTWANSGLTLSAFARQCGLSVKRLHRWKKRLEGREGPMFHPVEVVMERRGGEGSGNGSGVELIVRGGYRISLSRGFDREVLQDLIDVLESGSC